MTPKKLAQLLATMQKLEQELQEVSEHEQRANVIWLLVRTQDTVREGLKNLAYIEQNMKL